MRKKLGAIGVRRPPGGDKSRVLEAVMLLSCAIGVAEIVRRAKRTPKDDAYRTDSVRAAAKSSISTLATAEVTQQDPGGDLRAADPRSTKSHFSKWPKILLTFISVGITALAWLTYRAATPPIPQSQFQGAVAAYVYGAVARAKISVEIDDPASPEPLMFITLVVRTSRTYPADACLPYAIALAGDAEIKSSFLGHPNLLVFNSAKRFALEVPGERPLVKVQMTQGGGLCRQPFSNDRRVFRAVASGNLKSPVAARSGPATSYQLPIVFPLRRSFENPATAQPNSFLQEVYPPYNNIDLQGDETQVAYNVPRSEQEVSAGDVPPDSQIDASAPSPSGSTNTLSWESSQILHPTATLVNILGQQQADRWLFWSGILAGIAASVWLWATQLWIQPYLGGNSQS